MSGGGAQGRALKAFSERLGGRPRWGAAAPGRVNLIGEHTDYSGGFVLPMALEQRCVAVAGAAADPGASRVFSVDLGEEWRLDVRAGVRLGMACGDGEVLRRGSPISYVAGVFAGFQFVGRGMDNLDIAIASDVPIGSGLSSSAAVEVSIATLLEQAYQAPLEAMAKVRLCQQAEHEWAGVPCGIMDQMASVLGRQGHALLIDCRTLAVEAVALPRGCEVLVVNTNVRHALADGEYARRREACARAARGMGVDELRDADERTLVEAAGKLDEEAMRCARHVVMENARVLTAAAALRAGELARFGELMRESHRSLRDDFRVSCAELDAVVELAAGPGVLGARMTGAGFGGCAVVLVERGSGEEVGARLGAGYRQRIGGACTAGVVRAGGGAEAIAV